MIPVSGRSITFLRLHWLCDWYRGRNDTRICFSSLPDTGHLHIATLALNAFLLSVITLPGSIAVTVLHVAVQQ